MRRGTRRDLGRAAAAALLVVPALLVPTNAGASDLPEVPDLRALPLGAVVPGSWIVSVRSGEPAEIARTHGAWGVTVTHVLDSALKGYTARMTDAVAARVAADPRVRTVRPDRVIRAAAQETPTGVARVGAKRALTKVVDDGLGAVDADVAVLDTGVDTDHPDLTVAGGFDCVSSGAGYEDQRGHGTQIAGIVAAKDNDFGVVGVAPGARVWAVRVLDSFGDGSSATLACGVDWVTRNAATIEVANMSLVGIDFDGGCRDGGLHEAICTSVAAGVTFVAAAGNDGADASEYSPASYPEVLTVSALADYDGEPGAFAEAPLECTGGDDDEFATFSNYGPVVDFIAPGVCIKSTWIGGAYATLSGTSQAAAHVTGAAAIYLARNGGRTPAQVAAALRDAAGDDWSTDTDPDSTPDPLVDVSRL
ncbi:MAG: S8 family serine peptidase [Sporichthyaceae bacterium]